ncbi:MAG: methyltransferase domain-containing protein [Nitrospira sp.]|nr:methyltransferase domain-containing protein [Nitrospira sp.]
MTDPGQRLLNIGCGPITHACWTNVDVWAADPSVILHDLHKPLPFDDQSYDAAYASHVLEHFAPDAAHNLLRECYRVLKPGSIMRVVVPDLEAIARGYLEALDHAGRGHARWEDKYDWMMLELLDQLVRTTPGGMMGPYMRKPLDNEMKEFIATRIGSEGLPWPGPAGRHGGAQFRLVDRIRKWVKKGGGAIRIFMAQACVRALLGASDTRAFQDGLFRATGENHVWMYDRFSLKRLLLRTGFTDVEICSAFDSHIPRFPSFELDVQDHKPRKPDSLYMEGRRP